MTLSFDKCRGTMFGQALANNLQISTYMAIALSQSLRSLKRFDPSDVMSYYLHLFYTMEYPMGEAAGSVYEELKAEITSKNNKLTRQNFVFPVERILKASRSAHDRLRGLSAGCNPAQRSYILALCPWIADEELFEISCEEARLTHFSHQAGQVSGIVNLICRRLLRGDEWSVAIDFAFQNTMSDLSSDIKEIQLRHRSDPILNHHGDCAYAPNVLHTTLYCVTNTDSYDSAVKLAHAIDGNYCPTLVGILAGARWGVPKAAIDDCPTEQRHALKEIAKCFVDGWVQQWVKANKPKK